MSTDPSRRTERATDIFQAWPISRASLGHDSASQLLNLWRFYDDRVEAELLIKQLNEDYALSSLFTRHFMANETYFHLLLFAYNL